MTARDDRLVPASKHDLQACANLACATDAEVCPLVPQLLTWLQDLNWPVAPRVCDRLARLDDALVEPVRAVLLGDDELWKYWLISALLPKTSARVVGALSAALTRIALHPTGDERREEVDVVARALLDGGRR